MTKWVFNNMTELDYSNKSLEVDVETVTRLLAISKLFAVEEGIRKTPEMLVSESIGRVHTTLLKAKPNYKVYYDEYTQKAMEAEKAEQDGSDEDLDNIQFIDYPEEFMDLDTGIESIFLKRRYQCPFCEAEFSAPSLKTGSLLVKMDNRTQMEVYTGVRQDSEKEFVDYSLFHILLCPKCLYAASEKEFDLWDSASKDPHWIRRKRAKLSKKVIAGYHERLKERMAIAQKAGQQGMQLFSTERTEEDAAISLDLAAHTLNFLISKVSANRKSELLYQLGQLQLMKSLQYEKQLEDPEFAESKQDLMRKRRGSVKNALECFLKIPESSVENFDVREGVKYNCRKFWAAYELKQFRAFAQAGSALQRIFNQFSNLIKKAEREFVLEEAKLKKTRSELKKTKNIQKKEQINNRLKEIDKNMQLIRSGMENYRSVIRVVTPIWDNVSVVYDKFIEAQRRKKRAQA